MPTYKYEDVSNVLRDRIRTGTYPPGSKLPTRQQIRAEFGVSDMVLTYAMRILRLEGLVDTLNGVGTFVVKTLPPG